jgi:hypothetical protein
MKKKTLVILSATLVSYIMITQLPKVQERSQEQLEIELHRVSIYNSNYNY